MKSYTAFEVSIKFVQLVEIRIKNSHMLGTCNLTPGSRSQSSIRHQVRKLRAKVRALIPSETCAHFQKRNHQVEMINARKTEHTKLLKQQNKTASEPRLKHGSNTVWRFGNQKQQPYHTSSERNGQNQCKHHTYQFEKLKLAQLEQINEDKIYYLGEKNIEAYDNFLRDLKSKMLIDTFPTSTLFKSMKSAEMYAAGEKSRFSRQVESVSLWDANRSKGAFQSLGKIKKQPTGKINKADDFSTNWRDNIGQKQLKFRNSTTSISKWNSEAQIMRSSNRADTVNEFLLSKKSTNGKLENKTAEQRRQQIDEQQRQKRIYQRIKMDMQMARAQANQRQIKYKQFSKIKEMQTEEKQKHERAIKKKSVLMKKGEIIKFNEQLRNIMMRRKNRSHSRSSSCFYETRPASTREL